MIKPGRFLILLFSSLVFINTVFASDPLIKIGATREDVVKQHGAPLEKVEKESKREEVWSYNSFKVTFFNGKVRAVKNLSPVIEVLNIDQQEKAAKTKRDVPVDNIISEILKEIPGGSDSAGGSPMQAGQLENKPLEIVQ